MDDSIRNQPNITGVEMRVSPARQLTALTDVAPTVKRLGLVYNPGRTAETAAKEAAGEMAGQILTVRISARYRWPRQRQVYKLRASHSLLKSVL